MKLAQQDIGTLYRETQKSLETLRSNCKLLNESITGALREVERSNPVYPVWNHLHNVVGQMHPPLRSLGSNVALLCRNDALEQDRIIAINNELEREEWQDEAATLLESQLQTALENIEELRQSKAQLQRFVVACKKKNVRIEQENAEKEEEIVALRKEIEELQKSAQARAEPIEIEDKAVDTDELVPALDHTASLHQQIDEEKTKTEQAKSDLQTAKSRYDRETERMKCQLETIEGELEALIEEKSSLEQTRDAERIDAKNSIERLEEELEKLRLESSDSGEGPHSRNEDEIVRQLRRNKIYPGNCSSAVMVTIGAKTGEWAMDIIKRAMCWSYKHSANSTRSTSRERPFQASVILFLALGFAYNMYDRKGGVDPAAMDDESEATVREHIEYNVDVLVDAMVRSNVSLGAFDSADALKHDAKKLISATTIANKIKNLKAAGRNRWRTTPPPNTGDNKRPNIHIKQYEIYTDMQIPFHEESNWSEWIGGQWVTQTK